LFEKRRHAMDELYQLIKMIKELKLIDKVAQELGIKPSSVRRQINRIEAFYEGREVQKRSGKRKGAEYTQAMKKVLERELGRPIRVKDIDTKRQIVFNNLKDALKYSEPIGHISSIRKEGGYWIVKVPKTSDELPYEDWVDEER
jgi:molybdenum-dependent DNA-binding transcriptional regulator ModE